MINMATSARYAGVNTALGKRKLSCAGLFDNPPQRARLGELKQGTEKPGFTNNIKAKPIAAAVEGFFKEFASSSVDGEEDDRGVFNGWNGECQSYAIVRSS
jgi:hypothetical protein